MIRQKVPMEFTSEWFDHSTRAWLANKKRNGHSYKYVCGVETCKIATRNMNCVNHSGRGIELTPKPLSTQAMKQESVPAEGYAQHPHTVESPIEPLDLSVAYRVVRRRREMQSR